MSKENEMALLSLSSRTVSILSLTWNSVEGLPLKSTAVIWSVFLDPPGNLKSCSTEIYSTENQIYLHKLQSQVAEANQIKSLSQIFFKSILSEFVKVPH